MLSRAILGTAGVVMWTIGIVGNSFGSSADPRFARASACVFVPLGLVVC